MASLGLATAVQFKLYLRYHIDFYLGVWVHWIWAASVGEENVKVKYLLRTAKAKSNHKNALNAIYIGEGLFLRCPDTWPPTTWPPQLSFCKLTPAQVDPRQHSPRKLTPITSWPPVQDDPQYKITPGTRWPPVQLDPRYKMIPSTRWLPVQLNPCYKMTPGTRWPPVQIDT